MRKIITAVALAAGLLVAGCGSMAQARAPASARPSHPPAPASTPPAASDLSGSIGTVFTDSDGNGNKMDVTLTNVIDPAQGADQYTAPSAGNRFVGAVFTIKGVTGSFSGDANNNASLIGANGQTYIPDFSSITGYTNFNSGLYNVGTGEISVGAVTFQVPGGVKIAKIEWGNEFAGTPAEWLVPAVTAAAPAVTGPWGVVSAFYADITSHDYAGAWKLLGLGLRSQGYAGFAAGYTDTGSQTVTKTSESGAQVSFTLRSDNPDGTVQTYQGTDTVTGGTIVAANIVQTS